MTVEATADFDLTGYFGRIAYTGPTEPTLDVLTALVAAHNRSIPFENLDPVMGVPVADLGPDTLFGKLVGRRRGGYCYEQNGLMAYVLSQLGFKVDLLGGRVVWMNTSGTLPAMTHLTLAVTVPGVDGRYLVDVGFGGQTLSSPIRLREHDDGYMLESEIRGTWEPLYMFTTRPQPLIDRVVGSWYVSTYPESGFVTGLSAALVTDDARWNLRGRNLAIHSGGETERVRFDTAAQVLEALTGRFGIDLTGFGDVEARVNRVLDS